jgi:hypothetical protein
MLTARRLRAESVRSVVIVAHAVKVRASTLLTRSVLLTKTGHAARVGKVMVRAKAAIIMAINLPN